MSAIETVRHSLNQLTDHGSQKCLDCLEHRRVGISAVDDLKAALTSSYDVLNGITSASDFGQFSSRRVRKLLVKARDDCAVSLGLGFDLNGKERT